MWSRSLLAFALAVCLLSSSVAYAQGQFDFNKAQYLVPEEGGKKGRNVDGVLRFDGSKDEIQFLGKENAPMLTVSYASVKSLLYERSAKPRYAAALLIAWPLIFTKSKSHYLTVQYTDASGEGKFAIFRLHKSNFREAVARAEASTGHKVERTEER